MSNFDQADRSARHNDKRRGERIELLYLQDGLSDPNRKNQTIKAILNTSEAKPTNANASRDRNWKVQISATRTTLYITKSTYSGPALADGDKIRAIDRTDKPFFEIQSINRRDPVRLIATLGEA